MLFALAAAAAAECNGVPLARSIDDYAELIRRQDSAAIARQFGADGEIDNPGAAPIKGEAAIRTFLASFKGAVVKSEAMTIRDISLADKDWHVVGSFHQTGRTPEGKDYDVSGSFDSTWTCTDAGWRVRHMATGK